MASVVKFWTHTQRLGITEVTIQYKDIELFGIQCYKQYYKNGWFKLWKRGGYIYANDVKYRCSINTIVEIKKNLKEQFSKGKWITKKFTFTDKKYSPKNIYLGERSATEWSYELITKNNHARN